MKIAILGNAGSVHIVRWANGLVERGLLVHVISAHPSTGGLDRRVILHQLQNKAPIGYIGAVFELRGLLKAIRPDLLNAHYATGYGLLARLARFKPFLLSVWGSDVYLFPNKSIFHRALLRANLRSASAIASTSLCMSTAVRKHLKEGVVFITPFGIDESYFSPSKILRTRPVVVIGTVKALKHEYGIDTLIEAFSILLKDFESDVSLHLEITGAGVDSQKLKDLAGKLGVSKKVTFHGQVPHSKVPEMLARLDVYVALSRSESFGVAILEASACEKPVVVSDADGPTEVTIGGVTGFIVKKDNAIEAADAISKLIRDPELRATMGRAGRAHVVKNYTWKRSIDLMLQAYKEMPVGNLKNTKL